MIFSSKWKMSEPGILPPMNNRKGMRVWVEMLAEWYMFMGK